MSDCYIGRLPCGCVECAVVVEPSGMRDPAKWRREVAKDIADWIRRGCGIERVSAEYVREHLTTCTHRAKTRPSTQEVLDLGGLAETGAVDAHRETP